jgi:hypothetical protein
LTGTAGAPLPTLSLDGQATALEVDRDWRPLAFSSTGAVQPAELVFAGYGLLAPAEEDFPAYDSYAALDVTAKWVLAFRYLPEDLSAERRQVLREYAELRFKAMVARQMGARGLILVSGRSAQVREQLIPLSSEAAAGCRSLPVISITDAIAAKLLAPAGKDLEALQKALDLGNAQAGFELPDVRVSADIRLDRREASDRNVLGRLYAGDEPGDSLVIVGAHADHIGQGEDQSSCDEDPDTGKIH